MEKRGFREELTRHAMLDTKLVRFYDGFRSDAHPMAVMVGTGRACWDRSVSCSG